MDLKLERAFSVYLPILALRASYIAAYPLQTGNSSHYSLSSKLILSAYSSGLTLSIATYLFECVCGHLQQRQRVGGWVSKTFRRATLLLGPFAWLLVTSAGMGDLSTQSATTSCAPSPIDPDIAGIGVLIALYVNGAVVFGTAILGQFHAEESGITEVAAILWVTLATYIFNVWKAYIMRSTGFDNLAAVMVTDAYTSLISITNSMRDRLVEPKVILVGLLTQAVGLVTIAFVVANLPRSEPLPGSGTSESDCRQCFRTIWWGEIDSCLGIAAAFWIHYALRIVSWLHECWLCARTSRIYNVASIAANTEKVLKYKNVIIARTVHSSVPATAFTKYLEASFCFLGTAVFMQKTLRDLGSEEAKLWNTWGQTAQLCAAGWIAYRWIKRVSAMFTTESVERRQEILDRTSFGTLVPRLSHRSRTSNSSQGVSVKLMFEQFRKIWHRHPFGKLPPRRAVDHARLHKLEDAWKAIELKFLQWPSLSLDEKGQLLLTSAKQGDMVFVRDLLVEEAPVNHRDSDERSPLLHATSQGHVDVVRILLDNAADRNLRGKDGCTALHLAIDQGRLDLVDLILPGANLNLKRKEDTYTALCLAARLDHGRIFQMLLMNGADPEIVDKNRQTPLHICARYGRDSIAELILQNGTNPDLTDKDGWTALHIAARYERQMIGGHLLEAKANPNLRDIADNWTPLDVAIRYGREEMVRTMIEYGAEYDTISDSVQRNSLNLSLFYGREEASDLLIKKGANIHVRNQAGESALYIAASRRRRAMRMLLTSGAEISNDEQELFIVLLIATGLPADSARNMVINEGTAEVVHTLLAAYRP